MDNSPVSASVIHGIQPFSYQISGQRAQHAYNFFGAWLIKPLTLTYLGKYTAAELGRMKKTVIHASASIRWKILHVEAIFLYVSRQQDC